MVGFLTKFAGGVIRCRILLEFLQLFPILLGQDHVIFVVSSPIKWERFLRTHLDKCPQYHA